MRKSAFVDRSPSLPSDLKGKQSEESPVIEVSSPTESYTSAPGEPQIDILVTGNLFLVILT